MSEVVLDASAVLAVLYEEAGAAIVIAHLSDCVIGAVNLVEVVSKLIDDGIPENEAWLRVKGFTETVVPFDEAQARLAAAMRAQTRAHNISLGDRACLALARQRGATALTADRGWKKLKLDIAITCIR